jgi:hypothetical protein
MVKGVILMLLLSQSAYAVPLPTPTPIPTPTPEPKPACPEGMMEDYGDLLDWIQFCTEKEMVRSEIMRIEELFVSHIRCARGLVPESDMLYSDLFDLDRIIEIGDTYSICGNQIAPGCYLYWEPKTLIVGNLENLPLLVHELDHYLWDMTGYGLSFDHSTSDFKKCYDEERNIQKVINQ